MTVADEDSAAAVKWTMEQMNQLKGGLKVVLLTCDSILYDMGISLFHCNRNDVFEVWFEAIVLCDQSSVVVVSACRGAVVEGARIVMYQI